MRIHPLVFFLILLALPMAAQAWQADPEDKLQLRVEQTLDAFRVQRPEIQTYLDEAYGFAVFPNVVKIGAMWGGAYGKGLVIENNQLVGRCSQWLGSLGAQLGAQSYRQLILFKTEEAMDTFKRGRVEFEGRASAVVAKSGAAIDPANLPEVAIFSLVKGGLMAELAAAGVKYTFKPIESASEID